MTALHAVCFYTGAVVISGVVVAFLSILIAGCLDVLREWRRLTADRRFVAATAQPLINEPTVTDWDTEYAALLDGWGR